MAICRALITEPRLILADEPTGSLDPATAADVLRLLIEQVKLNKATLLLVTHDHSLLKHMDRTIDMADLLTSRRACSEPTVVEFSGQPVAPQEPE